MPVVHFRVRWPDGSLESCYSPSTIIQTYFEAGKSYALTDFVGLCRQGLHAASDRVRARYGSGCSNAMAQLAAIEAKALRQPPDAAAMVRVEGFDL